MFDMERKGLTRREKREEGKEKREKKCEIGKHEVRKDCTNEDAVVEPSNSGKREPFDGCSRKPRIGLVQEPYFRSSTSNLVLELWPVALLNTFRGQ